MFKEFCQQTSADEIEIQQRWMKIERQIFQYAPLEEKKTVRDILSQYNAIDEINAGEGEAQANCSCYNAFAMIM